MDKKCSKCGMVKINEEFHFRQDRHGYNAWCKQCVYAAQKARWKDRKRKAVDLMGGACQLCGYNKNYAALDFHHEDPKQKEFSWEKGKLVSWKKLMVELQKCKLVCRNCHAELHHPSLTIVPLNELRDNNLLNAKGMEPTSNCPICSQPVFGTKYCSKACAHLGQRKVVRPEKKELEAFLGTMPIVAIAQLYGVSDNAIRKWIRGYNLDTR